MLKYTMGAPDAYKLRAEEIHRLHERNNIIEKSREKDPEVDSISETAYHTAVYEVEIPAVCPQNRSVDHSSSSSTTNTNSTTTTTTTTTTTPLDVSVSNSRNASFLNNPSEHPELGFLAITDPEHGVLTRYLELGQISLILGDVMFVHGALFKQNMGYYILYYYQL